MSSTKKSRAECAREYLDTISLDKPLGPRATAWNAEIDAKLEELKTLDPGCEKFNEIVARIMQLNKAMGCRRWCDVRRQISSMFDPALPKKAAELERLLDGKKYRVSIITEWTQYANGWFPGGYVAVHTDGIRLDLPTADNLAQQVVDAIRRDAQGLAAMANRIEKQAAKKSKRKVA